VKYGLYKKEQGDCAVVEKIENPKADESVRPLLKWTGGKRALAPEIVPLLEGYGRYFEPFFGGGAVFFKLYPESSMLSDLNPELINCYETTKNHPEELIASLKRLKNTEETYYKVRASAPRTAVNRAARFIYLCALSFNGIYRVNLSGQFNVPYGRKKHIDPCDASLIRSISKRLKTCEILCADFEQSALKGRRRSIASILTHRIPWPMETMGLLSTTKRYSLGKTKNGLKQLQEGLQLKVSEL